MGEIKANWHQWRAGGVIVMVIVFHDDFIVFNNDVFSVFLDYLPSILAMMKMTTAPKRPPPPRR
jgi:hypothetical protein